MYENPLEKPDRISKPYAAADLWRYIFYERNMVVVKAISQIKGVNGENACVMFAWNNEGAGHVENTITGGRRFVLKNTVLVANGGKFRFTLRFL